MKFRKLIGQVAVSLAVAAITPAAAAGLVEGVKVAANTVGQDTDLQTFVPDGAPVAAPSVAAPVPLDTARIATAEPRRLSPLAGNASRIDTKPIERPRRPDAH